MAFFNPKTPVAKRVSLLQNGSTFASIIQAQASSALASSATSSVTAVTVESATQAKVTYSILVGGTAALKNQPGVAVKQGGVWKVGDQSFCALLTLENNGKAPRPAVRRCRCSGRWTRTARSRRAPSPAPVGPAVPARPEAAWPAGAARRWPWPSSARCCS